MYIHRLTCYRTGIGTGHVRLRSIVYISFKLRTSSGKSNMEILRIGRGGMTRESSQL